MDRSNPYEVAFESYLQINRISYIAIDETRRAPLGDDPVKSADFLIFTPNVRLIVDVKGRRFPGGTPQKPRRVWECWSFREDVAGLDRWTDLAGIAFRGLLVFAYLLHPTVSLPVSTPDLFPFHGDRYLFRAVDIAEYRDHMRPRSKRWDTVCLPKDAYRTLVRPFREFLQLPVAEEVPF